MPVPTWDDIRTEIGLDTHESAAAPHSGHAKLAGANLWTGANDFQGRDVERPRLEGYRERYETTITTTATLGSPLDIDFRNVHVIDQQADLTFDPGADFANVPQKNGKPSSEQPGHTPCRPVFTDANISDSSDTHTRGRSGKQSHERCFQIITSLTLWTLTREAYPMTVCDEPAPYDGTQPDPPKKENPCQQS